MLKKNKSDLISIDLFSRKGLEYCKITHVAMFIFAFQKRF